MLQSGSSHRPEVQLTAEVVLAPVQADAQGRALGHVGLKVPAGDVVPVAVVVQAGLVEVVGREQGVALGEGVLVQLLAPGGGGSRNSREGDVRFVLFEVLVVEGSLW